MKNILFIFSAVLIASVLIFGCGHRATTNPVGVLGGGDDGYGSLTGGNSSGYNNGGQYDQMLLGTWRTDYSANDYEILVIGSGNYQWAEYLNSNLQNSGSGTWYSSGEIIYATENGSHDQYPYTASSNQISINWGDGFVTYYRYSG
jgi:hypothetical protein